MLASIDPSGEFATINIANHSGSPKEFILKGFKLNATVTLDGNTSTSIPAEIDGDHALILDRSGTVLAEVKIEENEDDKRTEREIQQISSSQQGKDPFPSGSNFPSRIQGH